MVPAVSGLFPRAAPPGARSLSPAVHRAARAAWRREPVRSFVPFFASRADFGALYRAYRCPRIPCGARAEGGAPPLRLSVFLDCISFFWVFRARSSSVIAHHRQRVLVVGFSPTPLPSPRPRWGRGETRDPGTAAAGTGAARSKPSLAPSRGNCAPAVKVKQVALPTLTAG